MVSCEGMVGVVTGASGGLGRAASVALAESGATVIAASRNVQGLRETAELAAGLPGQVIPQQFDVTDETQVRRLVESVISDYDQLSFLVNNAGAQVEKPLLDTTNDDWDLVDATNVRGPFWACKYAIGHMRHRGGGSIVNVASALSVSADPMLPAYTTSKHAILGLTRSIAVTRDYAKAGIRANAILPADMETPMVARYFASHDDPAEARRRISSAYPMERIADPMEVARVIRFLVSAESSFVNGSSIIVDGGLLAALYTM